MKKIFLATLLFISTFCNSQNVDIERYKTMEFNTLTWNKYGYVLRGIPSDANITTEQDSLLIIESPDFRISMLVISRDNTETSVGQYVANTCSGLGLNTQESDIQYLFRYDGLTNGFFIGGDIVDVDNKPFYAANTILTLHNTHHFIYTQIITHRELADYANNIAFNYDIDLSQYDGSQVTDNQKLFERDGTIIFRDTFIALMQNTSLSFNLDNFTKAMQLLVHGFQLVFTCPTMAMGENIIEPELSFVSNDNQYVGRISYFGNRYYLALYTINEGQITYVPQLLYPCEIDEDNYDKRFFIADGDFKMELTASSQAAPGEEASAPTIHLSLNNSPTFQHVEFDGFVKSWIDVLNNE